MDAPFSFGKIVGDEHFTNRNEEIKRLTANFRSGINTVLISPRRWGKSSLVYYAASNIQKQKKTDIKFIFLDLFNVRGEEQFYELLARQTLKALSSRMDEILDSARQFLEGFSPRVTFSPTPGLDFSLSMNWAEVSRNPEEILFLPEKIATAMKVKVVVCVDEFQNIAFFENPLAFQKQLRANWQLHKQVSYCIFGSKRHMMMDVFNSTSMPFYKFGDIIFLEKIKTREWVTYIRQRFEKSGKTIDKESTLLIIQLVDNHPYYVQQLSQLSWLRTSDHCSQEIVMESFECLVLQLSMLFHSITDGLSNSQINFLRALSEDVVQLSAKRNLEKYQLGTSANIQRIKKALIEKEIIDVFPDSINILDPVYLRWLTDFYWKNKPYH